MVYSIVGWLKLRKKDYFLSHTPVLNIKCLLTGWVIRLKAEGWRLMAEGCRL
jgi:hypothetical protein